MNDKIKNAIKACLSINTYSNASFYSKIGNENRLQLEPLIKELSTQDYFEDIKPLKELQKKAKGSLGSYSTFDVNWSNAHIYGIWQGIFGEENLPKLLQLPAVEHGLIFHEDVFTDLRTTARHACVTFSDFRKNIIRSKLKRPVFCVGPYIHYCQGFYTKEKLAEYKSKLGRTLLVFPTHSTDTSELSIDQKYFLDNLSRMAKDFDSVLVNTFWWNINDPLTERLESEGYHIISGGFRDDPMFLQRLKSYIQLSDLVVGDSVGTHIGYCIDAGVPFSYQDAGTSVRLLKKEEIKDQDTKWKRHDEIRKVFENQKTITSEQIDICNRYWGLNQTRSVEEIKCIAEISEELTNLDHGFTGLADMNAKKLLKKYKDTDQMKYELMKKAL